MQHAGLNEELLLNEELELDDDLLLEVDDLDDTEVLLDRLLRNELPLETLERDELLLLDDDGH